MILISGYRQLIKSRGIMGEIEKSKTFFTRTCELMGERYKQRARFNIVV